MRSLRKLAHASSTLTAPQLSWRSSVCQQAPPWVATSGKWSLEPTGVS